LKARPPNIELPASLARLLSAYSHAGEKIPWLDFAAVKRVNGLESKSGHAVRGAITIKDSGEALLSLDGHFHEREETSGNALEILLADGSVVTTTNAFLTREGTRIVVGDSATFTSEFELNEWQWATGRKPVAWVGALRGVEFHWAYNLFVDGHGKTSSSSLRLGGNATWHLTRKGAFGQRSCVALIDTMGAPIGPQQLWHDFSALEFLFGTPLRLNLLIGVDENNEAVAAYGASFGYRFRQDASREPPLPDERDAAWIAIAFPLVARALDNPTPNTAAIATCGYVDSTLGHIDGQYLFAQVALEAVADKLVPEKKAVVKDVDAWKAWVRSQRSSFAEHAADDAAVDVLAFKLREACRPTTSRLVEQLLGRSGLAVPAGALREIDGRNVVAHTLSMTDGEPHDIERDVRRVRVIRTLLAATILRHVGYDGPIVGWDVDENGRRTHATWYPASDGAREKARQIYEAKVRETDGGESGGEPGGS